MIVARGVGDVASAGQFPVGSIGDQYQTCIQGGGDPASCAAAVVSVNPTAGASSASGLPVWVLPLSIVLLFAFLGASRR